MIGNKYIYNNLTLNDDDFKYRVTKIGGLDSPGIREARENRPAMDGQIDYGTLLSERLISIGGEILAGSILERNALRQNLLNAFITDGQYRWLKYQPEGFIPLQIYCKVFDTDVPEIIEADRLSRIFTINLLAIDPHIYSQEELTETVYIPSAVGGRVYVKVYPKTYGTIQTGGKITCTNNGNYSVIPIVKMYGPLSSPKIRNNNDSAKEILVNLVVADGDYLEVDFEEKTIMLNSFSSRYNYLSSDSEWWKILPGNNSIEFRDGLGNTNGKAEIIFRSGWI